MQKIFVGDVQGCSDEFEELLERARDHFGDDYEIWQVGDLVNRGPGNLRVLQLMRELVESGRGRCVLGNHDLSLVMIHLGLRTPKPQDTHGDVLEAPDVAEWIEWLRRRPVVEAGEIGGQSFAMLHAAAHPDWNLEKLLSRARRIEKRLADPDPRRAVELLEADPAVDRDADLLWRLTRCRSVLRSGAWSSEPPEEADGAWHRRWARRGHDYGVVYGHWSLQKLHVARGLRGLDTGCVHHGRGSEGFLTAWLPGEAHDERGAFDVPDDRFWHIPARRQYYGFEDAKRA